MDLKNKWNVLKTEKDFKLTQESNKIDWTSSSSGDEIPQNQSIKSSKKRKSNKNWKFKHEAKKIKFDETNDEIMKLINSGSLEQELDEITLSPIQDTSKTPSPILFRTMSPILNVTQTPTSIMPSCSYTSPILSSKSKKKRRLRNKRKPTEELLSLFSDAQVEIDESGNLFESSREIPNPTYPVLVRLEASEDMFTEALKEVIVEESEDMISEHKMFEEEHVSTSYTKDSQLSTKGISNQTSPVLLTLAPSEVMFSEEVIIEESDDLISQQDKLVVTSDMTFDIEKNGNLVQKIEEELQISEGFTPEQIIVEETEEITENCVTPIENSPDILTPSTTHATQISISVLSTQTSDELTISSPPIPDLNTEAFVDFSQKNKDGKRKTKKRPPKFGSESYKLQELLRKQKSDVAFWRHERFLNVKTDIIDGALILKGCVQKFWKEYNKMLILCKLETEDGVVLVIINQKLGKTLQDNILLTIYPPYIRRKMMMNNICYDSLLNVNKIIIGKYFW